MRHDCPGDSTGPTPGAHCPRCEAAIDAAESRRDDNEDTYEEVIDWSWPAEMSY